MTQPTSVSRIGEALASRARTAMSAYATLDVASKIAPPDEKILATLERYLLDGETHYPVRPGMTELREAIDARLAEVGTGVRGPGAVLVCASAGEAAFVTVLALADLAGGTLWAQLGERHDALVAWTGVNVVADDPGGDALLVRDLGSDLFGEARIGVRPDEIVVGDLDGLGLAPFSVGFVAGPPDVVAAITKWKQASSICAPSPSQRAALSALGIGS